MSTYRTKGIILKRADFGEANLLLHIFTEEYGKIEAVGKSARKAQGKLKGNLEPFLYSDLLLVHGKKMDTIAGSFALEPFLDLRNSFELVLSASVIVEIADRMTIEGYREEKIFRLILESLCFLDQISPADRKMQWLSILFFEVNFLSLSGFAPQAERCVFCGQKMAPGGNFFSFSLGGILDSRCAVKIPDAIPIEDDVIRLLRFLVLDQDGEIYADSIRKKIGDMRKLQVGSETIFRGMLVMKKFIEFNIDQKINSLQVLREFAGEKI